MTDVRTLITENHRTENFLWGHLKLAKYKINFREHNSHSSYTMYMLHVGEFWKRDNRDYFII